MQYLINDPYLTFEVRQMISYYIQVLFECDYCQTSNISRTLVGNKIVDQSDVVGAVPTGDAPTTSSFAT